MKTLLGTEVDLGPGHIVSDGNPATLRKEHSSQLRYDTDAAWGVPEGVHIGATCRIRINCPCAAVMRPHVKLL